MHPAKKYRVHQLVYYETHATMEAAIRRERQLKEWRRLWKIRLIESMNPGWADLFDEAPARSSTDLRTCRGACVDQENSWSRACVPAWSDARPDGRAWRRDDGRGGVLSRPRRATGTPATWQHRGLHVRA
jgi:hypothetical protein